MRAKLDAFKLRVDQIVAEGEIADGVRKLIIGHQGHFVGRAEARGDGDQALLHLVGLFLREIVVNENDGGKRKGIGRKSQYLLLLAILENTKIVLLEVAHQPAIAVLHRDREEYDLR